VKLHLLLDHDGYLPSFAVITEGKKHEVRVVRRLRWHDKRDSCRVLRGPGSAGDSAVRAPRISGI
jgi:hypothetical protein